MAKVRSYMEVTPEELRARPVLANFGPFEKPRIVRFGWFCWFWTGESKDGHYLIAVGPVRSRRRAQRIWDTCAKDWARQRKESAAYYHPPGDE